MGSDPGLGGEMKEGIIKFRCEWTQATLAVDSGVLEALQRWRTTLRKAGLIGVLPDGVGFGNLSVRAEDQSFLITGSGTGGLAELDSSHYSLVTEYHIQENVVHCRGQALASSESLSHAALYIARPDVGAVIHIHSEALWEMQMKLLPTTERGLAYGTPEMALALVEIGRGLDEGQTHTVVMGGHKDGLITFGHDIERAGKEVLRLAASAQD
jgi:L-ribulose-5-phosphate 4-epimerase